MATLWSNILTHFTIYLPLNLVSFLILRHSFIQCQWIFANWSLSKLEKIMNESICCKFIISVHNYVYVWFVMLTTFRENFREGWTVRWSKRGTIFCYFSLTRTFLFILIFFGFLNCIYQAFTTDFYLLSFSLTTLYQLLKLHLVVRGQNHGLTTYDYRNS